MTRMYLDIETRVRPHPQAEDILLIGWAVDDMPVQQLSFEAVQDHGIHEISPPGTMKPFLDLLADPEVTTVEHGLFDFRHLALSGFEIAGPVENTQVMAYTLNENTPLDLDWLAWRYAGLDMDKQLRRTGGQVYFISHDETRKPVNLDDMMDCSVFDPDVWEEFAAYNVRDVEGLRRLHGKLLERLEEAEWREYWETEEVPYTRVLARMECRGLPVDVGAVSSLADELRPEMERLAEELRRDAGLPPSFNLNSPQQLSAYLFSRVVDFTDSLVYDRETIECIKSCMDGEHDDCIDEPVLLGIHETGEEEWEWDVRHVVDMLPEGFTLDRLGRDRVHGHWTVKGRGLAPTPKTKNPLTGEEGKYPSTASPELLYMHAGDPWVLKLCAEYRKVETLLSTFLKRWPEQAHEGRLYGRFNQTGTVTGRLSSSGPNLQNVPARGERGKKVRGLFVAKPGTLLVVGDYDQLEMRLMAHLSGDPQLTRIFREGLDPHEELAYTIFGKDIDCESIPTGAACSYRDAAKTLNYAMGYGAGPKKVAQTLSLLGWATTKDEARDYLKEMARFYRGLFRYNEAVKAKAKRKGSVQTLGGHRRRLRAAFKDVANHKLVGYGERQAVNAVVQGTAADILRRVMVRVEDELPELRMLAQVHDELVFEIDDPHDDFAGMADALHVLSQVAERGHGFDLKVPLLFTPHTGHSWGAAKAGSDADIVSLLMEGE